MDNPNHQHTAPQLIIEDIDSTSSSDSDIEGGTVPTVARQLSRTPSVGYGPLSSPLHSHLHELGGGNTTSTTAPSTTTSGSSTHPGYGNTSGPLLPSSSNGTNSTFLNTNGTYSIGLNGTVHTPSVYRSSSYGFMNNTGNTGTSNHTLMKNGGGGGGGSSSEPYSPRFLNRTSTNTNASYNYAVPLFTTQSSANPSTSSSFISSSLTPTTLSRSHSSSSSSSSLYPPHPSSSSSPVTGSHLSPNIVTEESAHEPSINQYHHHHHQLQKNPSYSTLTSTSTSNGMDTDTPTDHDPQFSTDGNAFPSAPPLSLRIDVASTLKRQESIDPFEALFIPKTPLSLPARFTTPIHEAVREGQVSTLTRLLSAASQGTGTASGLTDTNLVNDPNEYGFTPLMLASAYEGTEEIAESLLSLLLGAGADVHKKDNLGMTALHWATECTISNSKGYSTTEDTTVATDSTLGTKPATLHTPRINILIKYGADVNCQDNNGDTPLHRACRSGRTDALRALMRAGANPRIANRTYVTPYDVAGHRGDENGTFDFENRKVATEALIEEDPSLRVLVLHHPDCLQHVTWRGHQEAPERVIEIMNYVRDPARFHSFELNVSTDVPLADTDTVIRAHTPEYFDLVKRLASHVERLQQPVPFTPQIKRYKRINVDTPDPGVFPSDTTFSAGSFRAALRAAGSVCRAVDAVVKGESRYALCCVRPPGHHAGVEGLILDGESHDSCGFCIFNNVAIGALHAMKTYPSIIKRVAIVDIDVHHGNGTEEIVKRWAEMQRVAKEMQKRMNPHATTIEPVITDYHADQSMFFFSVHLFDVTDPSKNRRKNEGANNGNNGTTIHPTGGTDSMTSNNGTTDGAVTNTGNGTNDNSMTNNTTSANQNANGGRSLRPRREILPKKLSMDEDAEMDTINANNNGTVSASSAVLKEGRRTRPSSRAGPSLSGTSNGTGDYDSGTNTNQNSGRVSARKKARFTATNDPSVNNEDNGMNMNDDAESVTNGTTNDAFVSASQNKIVTTPSRVIDVETDNNAYPIIKGDIGSPDESVPLKPVKYMVSEIKLTTGRNSTTKTSGSSSSTTPIVPGSRRKIALTTGSTGKGSKGASASMTEKGNTSNLNLSTLFSPRLTSPTQISAGLIIDTNDDHRIDHPQSSADGTIGSPGTLTSLSSGTTSNSRTAFPVQGFRIVGYEISTLSRPGIPLDDDTKLSIINYINNHYNTTTTTTTTVESSTKPPTGRKITLKMDKKNTGSTVNPTTASAVSMNEDTSHATNSHIQVTNNTFMDALLEVAVAESSASDVTPTNNSTGTTTTTVSSRKRGYKSLTPEPSKEETAPSSSVDPPPVLTRQPTASTSTVVPVPETVSLPNHASHNVTNVSRSILQPSPQSSTSTNLETTTTYPVLPPRPTSLSIERTSSYSETANSDPLLHIHPGGISLTPRIQSIRTGTLPNGSPTVGGGNTNGVVLLSPSQTSALSFTSNLRRSISAFTLPPTAQSPSLGSNINRTHSFHHSLMNNDSIMKGSTNETTVLSSVTQSNNAVTATMDGVSTISDQSGSSITPSGGTSSHSVDTNVPVHPAPSHDESSCQHHPHSSVSSSSSQQYIGTLVVAGDAAIAAAKSISSDTVHNANNNVNNNENSNTLKNSNGNVPVSSSSAVPSVVDASSSMVIDSATSVSGANTILVSSSSTTVSATSTTTTTATTNPPPILRPGVIPPPIVTATTTATTNGPVPSEEGVYKFYPGSGRYDCMEANIINAPIPPKWKDRKDRRDRNLRDPKKSQFGRLAAQRIIYSRLIPALRAFSPDLIIISSGFDAGKGDAGNRHTRLGYEGMDLLPEDFAWITRQILAIARVCCPGRVISVLEGGYGRMVSAKAAGLTTTVTNNSTVNPSTSLSSTDTTNSSIPTELPPSTTTTTATTATTSSTVPSEDSIVFLRDILAANCSAHLRALVDDGGAFQMEATDMLYYDE